jgi:hypothetical protein
MVFGRTMGSLVFTTYPFIDTRVKSKRISKMPGQLVKEMDVSQPARAGFLFSEWGEPRRFYLQRNGRKTRHGLP